MSAWVSRRRQAAIALEMTECDVVKRAGSAGRVEIGANDRRERTATITYTGGERPGIYSFTDGRLKSRERGPDPPAAHQCPWWWCETVTAWPEPSRITSSSP